MNRKRMAWKPRWLRFIPPPSSLSPHTPLPPLPSPVPADFNDDKLKVLQATQIERLIADHLTLKAKGRELVGLCPFHDDQRPSMTVVPSKQIYKCFSCGAGGDAITFVMDYHHLSFFEALKYLAERAGIELKPRARSGYPPGGSDDRPSVSKSDLVAANQFAADYFKVILRHPEHGASARAVLERRAVSPAMIEQFGLGASADKWDGLAIMVGRKGLPVEPFIAAGLLRARENGHGHYDAFRNRLMFPITDQLGRVVAFGARRLNDADEPKYLNSADSPVFSKSGTLYALPQALAAIRQSQTAIITEGYMDTIACHQAGVANAIATLGTALTPTNAKILSRLCRTVVLLFDGDEAGQRAADRAVEILFSSSIDVKIATLSSLKPTTLGSGVPLPVPKDPDELLKQEGGKERLLALMDAAPRGLDYRMSRFASTLPPPADVGARARAIEEELEKLVEVGLADLPPERRVVIERRVGALINVDEHLIRRKVSELGSRRLSNRGATTTSREEIRAGNASQRVLACLLAEPVLAQSLPREQRVAILSPALIAHRTLEKVAKLLDSMLDSGNALSTQSVMAHLDDPAMRSAVTSLVAELHRMTSHEPSRLRSAFEDERRRAWHDALVLQAQGAATLAERIRITQLAKLALQGASSSPSSSVPPAL